MSSTIECLRTDHTDWEIGPYHGSLPGPMRLRLKLDGEIIVSGQVETGFLHRGLEKAMELHEWRSSISYADHLDPEAAVYGELALSLAAEEIAGVEVPSRAVAIRLILSELTRLSSHMIYIVRFAKSAGADTLVHYVLRDRERILDLFELLTGARFSLNFLRFGGVQADVTEGFIERVLEVCEMIRGRIKEYNDLFTFNHTFLIRTCNVGVISPDLARAVGMTGPNARASGIAFDVRKAHPYLSYRYQDFEVPLGAGEGGTLGDCHDRFLIRLREMSASLEILRYVAETIPPGDFIAPGMALLSSTGRINGLRLPAGEAYSRVESSRGLLGCHLISDGSEKPARVQFRVPSVAGIQAIPRLLVGIRIEDLPVVLSSLDLCVAEADR